MLAWLKKIFSSKKVEEAIPAAPVETPAAPAENLTGTEEKTEEAPAQDMK
jgi:hypothetical protein